MGAGQTPQPNSSADQAFRFCLPLVALSVVWLSGCSVFRPGVFTHPNKGSDYVPADHTVTLDNSNSMEMYRKVRQAAAQNSIVLEVVGQDEPLRVLPLPPPGGRTVFVSDLLEQTGVLAKLSQINATLYRNSSDSIGGVRMEVMMNDDHDQIRPESDYALQAGDRLQVSKAELVAVSNFLSAALGI